MNIWFEITKKLIINIRSDSKWSFIRRFFVSYCSKKQILSLIKDLEWWRPYKHFIKEINRKYLNDIEIATSALNRTSFYFYHFSEKLKNNKEVFKLYVKNTTVLTSDAFLYVGENILNDSDIALIVIEKSPEKFKYLGQSIRNNKYLFLMTFDLWKENDHCRRCEPYLPYYIGNTLKLDKEVLLEVVKYYHKIPQSLYYLSYNLLLNEAKSYQYIALFAPLHIQKIDFQTDIILQHLKGFNPTDRSFWRQCDINGIMEDEKRLSALRVLLSNLIFENNDIEKELHRIECEISQWKRHVESSFINTR